MAKIRKFWISREELFDILGEHIKPTIIAAGNVGGLIEGSIPFADADGFLTEDNAALFWHAANEYLKITSASTLLLDLNPGFTGPGKVINITPSAAIDTVDAEWDGITIDGNALDPSVIGVQVDGLHIDFSTIDLANNPHLDGIYIQMPSYLDGFHAIHLEGELHIDLNAAGAITGETYTGLDVVIATTGSTGGDLHVLDVVRSGVGAVTIAAVATHEGIDVIHQAIGTFAAADIIWEYDADGAPWINVTAGVASIWDNKDDLLYVGHASTFSEIKFIFSAIATKDMHFKFYFSTGGTGWTRFFPADDTNGATQNGSVRYTAASLPTWAVDTVNGIAGKYWIKIERTRTSGIGPTTSSMQQLAPTLYGWDKLGVITALSITLTGTLDCGGPLTITQNSDTLVLSHDGSDAFVKWSDGHLILMTDEGDNTITQIHVKGKGTGGTRFFLYDEDDAESLLFFCTAGMGHLLTEGTSPQGLTFQNDAPQDIKCWPSINAGNPYFNIYGWDAGLGTPAVQYMRFQVDASGDGVIDIQSGNLLIPNSDVGIACTPTTALDVVGVISPREATKNRYGGMVTAVNSTLVIFGMNEGSGNLFGGAYTQADQGGMFRVDTRAGDNLFQWYGRAAGVAHVSGQEIASLTSAGVMTVVGCVNDGSCEIMKNEDALAIIDDILKTGSGKKDEYNHERMDMKKIYAKYPFMIYEQITEDEEGKKKKGYFDKLGAKSDLIYVAIGQLKQKIEALEAQLNN